MNNVQILTMNHCIDKPRIDAKMQKRLKQVSKRTSGTKVDAFTTVSMEKMHFRQVQQKKVKISQFDVVPLRLIPFWLVTRACQRY